MEMPFADVGLGRVPVARGPCYPVSQKVPFSGFIPARLDYLSHPRCLHKSISSADPSMTSEKSRGMFYAGDILSQKHSNRLLELI
jgi:hypothetical protein